MKEKSQGDVSFTRPKLMFDGKKKQIKIIFGGYIFYVYISIIQNTDNSIQNKVSKGAKIRNRYNQVPHLTQHTNGKATNLQLDTTNKSQEVSPFPAGETLVPRTSKLRDWTVSS